MDLSFGASGDLSSLRGVQASFLRPLSAIAATRGGAVPQARITRILADLAGPLSAFHRSGQLHGAISCDSIGLTAEGRADIILPPFYDPNSARDQALQAGRASSFNALEQYTDDPAWQVGPWTDVYSLCATCFRLITGSPPPSAIDRCLQERYIPLVEISPTGYDRTFLGAVDQGLSLRPHGRPSSIVQLLILMGMDADFAHRLCQAEDAGAHTTTQPAKPVAQSRPPAQAAVHDTLGSADPGAAQVSGQTAHQVSGHLVSNEPRRFSSPARMPWVYVPAGLLLAVFGGLMIWFRV